MVIVPEATGFDFSAIGLTEEGSRYFKANEGDVIETPDLDFKYTVERKDELPGRIVVVTRDEWENPNATGATKAECWSVRIADSKKGAHSWSGLHDQEIVSAMFEKGVSAGPEEVEQLRQELMWKKQE